VTRRRLGGCGNPPRPFRGSGFLGSPCASLPVAPIRGAKRLSRKERKDGNLTKDEFERINRKADKVLKSKD
jgi:hypothetical protein